MEKTYLAKRYDMANWWEKAILFFCKYKTHESNDGFVIYKTFHNRLYVYIHGHYYQPKPKPQDGGFNSPWSN